MDRASLEALDKETVIRLALSQVETIAAFEMITKKGAVDHRALF